MVKFLNPCTSDNFSQQGGFAGVSLNFSEPAFKSLHLSALMSFLSVIVICVIRHHLILPAEVIAVIIHMVNKEKHFNKEMKLSSKLMTCAVCLRSHKCGFWFNAYRIKTMQSDDRK